MYYTKDLNRLCGISVTSVFVCVCVCVCYLRLITYVRSNTYKTRYHSAV